jgi:hypothetical protein
MGQTLAEAISSVKRRSSLPTSQNLLTDADLAAILNEEMFSFMVPYVLKHRQEHFLQHADHTVASSLTDGYRLPSRAIKIREVLVVESDGTERQLPRVRVDQLPTTVDGFYLKGNRIYLTNNAAENGETIRVFFYLRPGELTDNTSNYDTVSSVTSTMNVLDGTGFGLSGVLDVIKKNAPHEHLLYDVAFTRSSNNFTIADDSNVETNDYVCVQGYSPVVQLPPELYVLLCQRAAVKVLEIIADQVALDAARSELVNMMKQLDSLVDDFIEGAPEKVINNELFGGE